MSKTKKTAPQTVDAKTQKSSAEIIKEVLVAVNCPGAAELDDQNLDAVLDLVAKALPVYLTQMKNSLIVIDHTLQVFNNMANRGAYPKELMEGQAEYLGRPGVLHLQEVLKQLLPSFVKKTEETKAKQ